MSDDVKKMPVPKLKKIAKELGVDSKLPLPKLRKAVEAALAKKDKPSAPETSEPSTAKGVSLGEVHRLLIALMAKVDAIAAALSGDESDSDDAEGASEEEDSEEDSESEEAESEETEEAGDEESEEEEEEEDEGGLPESIKPYLKDLGDDRFQLVLDVNDVDTLEEDVVRDLLEALGEDVPKKASPRKLQALLRAKVEEASEVEDDEESEAEEADEPEEDEQPAPKPKGGKAKMRAAKKSDIKAGKKVTFEEDGTEFVGKVVIPGEDDEELEDGCVRVASLETDDEGDPSWVIDVELSGIKVAAE